jgi:hypothetical protein
VARRRRAEAPDLGLACAVKSLACVANGPRTSRERRNDSVGESSTYISAARSARPQTIAPRDVTSPLCTLPLICSLLSSEDE